VYDLVMERPGVPASDRLTIGQLAAQGRVHLETIRYYERRGLLPRPPRTVSGYRAFPGEAVRRVRFIKRAQALGFSLREIAQLLALRAARGQSCVRMQAQAEAKIATIDAKLRQLRAMRGALIRLTATCDRRGITTACPILESLETENDE
jgi:MerR family transcriptional regulator, copper efflux regulator